MNPTSRSFRTASSILFALAVGTAGAESPDFSDTPLLSNLSFAPGSGFQLSVEGLPGEYHVVYSDDLSEWDTLSETVVAAEPVPLIDSESLGVPRRFYRIEEASLFPEYHTLLSTWGLQAEPGISSFLMGFIQPDGLFIDSEGEQVIVRRPADAFASTSIHFDGSVDVSGEYGLQSTRFAIPTIFAGGGITLNIPGDDEESDPSWELPMKPLGAIAPADGTANMLTGTSIRHATYDGGERFEFVQAFMARKSVDAGIDDLTGDWGIVRLEIEGDSEEILYTVLSAPVTISDEDGGTFALNGIEIETEMRHFFDGSDPERRYFEPTEIDFAFPIQVNPNGEVVLSIEGFGRPGQDVQHLAGFISPDANFLTLAEGWPSVYDARNEMVPEGACNGFAAHQLFLGVRRDPNPDLAGKEYRLEGQSFWVSRWDFEMLPSGPDGIAGGLSFDQNGEATLTLEDLIVRLPFYDGDQGGIIVETEDPDEIPLSYTIAPDGRLNFDMSDLTDPGDEAFFTGFAQEGGRALILGLGFAGQNDEGGDEGQISMWVATCVNCD